MIFEGGEGMAFLGKKSLFPVFDSSSAATKWYAKIERKQCFQLVAKKNRSFFAVGEKKVCPGENPSPLRTQQKIKWFLPKINLTKHDRITHCVSVQDIY